MKSLAQPAYYPMTLNLVVAGCNQKSNRDPLMELDEDTVWNTLDSLRQSGLVTRMMPAGSARTDRFKHEIQAIFGWEKPQRAVMAELLLRGAWIAPALRPFYAGVRANALGTYDHDRGYILDMRRSGTLGYNMESLTAYSAVLGWELTRNVRLRAEYTHQRIKMVDGVTQDITDEAKHPDYFAIEVGAGF